MKDERGAAVLLTFLLMLVLSGLALAVGVAGHNSVVGGRSQLLDKQAFYIAEAGWQKARTQLTAGSWSAGNTYTESFGAGEYKVTIANNGDGTYTLTSEGYVPDQTNTVARRQVVEANLSVTTGDTNLATSATASASSSSGSHTADKANDASTSTHWKANDEEEAWLQLDFGSAQALDKVVMKEKGKKIEEIEVQYSSNGSSWTTKAEAEDEDHPLSRGDRTWTITFSATSARYWRIFIEEADSKPRVYELEAYHTAGGGSTRLGEGAFTTSW